MLLYPRRKDFGYLTTMRVINATAFDDSVLMDVNVEVPAYKADKATGAMVETNEKSFSMSLSDLARQIYPLNADIATLRAVRKKSLTGEDWVKLLIGATIAVDFNFVKAGDKSGEGADAYVYENTGYIKTIKSFSLSDSVAARLDRALGF